MRTLLPIVLLSISLSAWADYAPTARPFQYTTHDFHGSPDTLSPLETQILKQINPKERSQYRSDNAHGKLLTMIVNRDGRYIAFIGQKAIHLGDQVGQMNVTRITQHLVVLNDGQNNITLSLEGPAKYSHTIQHTKH